MSAVVAADAPRTSPDLRYRWPGAPADTIAIDNLQLAPGDSVFLHGPSGCGKSTLLGLLAAVRAAATAGAVQLLGQAGSGLGASARDRHRADHVGYIFQQFNLLPYLSVLDNVLLPLPLLGRAGSALARRPAGGRSLLARTGLPRALWRPAGRHAVGGPAAAGGGGAGADRRARTGDRRRAHLGAGRRAARRLHGPAARQLRRRRQHAAVRQPRRAAGRSALTRRGRPAGAQPRRKGGRMTALLHLAARSAWNRRFVLALVVLSIALSTFLLLGLERLRRTCAANFSQAVSGHRPDRRRAHRAGAAAAVRGVPHRRRHQQHPHGQRARPSPSTAAWPGWCR
jgi:ABC-type Fe3+/spermidine/putrescine transport system ATPase subunit